MRQLLLLAVVGLLVPAANAASLDPAVLPTIQAATFEVVAAKPVNDPLTYEKPLPLELLPFQERNDKHFSIGTAFALGNNRYVTAAHVLLTGVDSLWGEPALRDAGGQVHAIGKVEKFSLQQDFVVFSLATQPAATAALELNAKPAMNDVVYAVGNALGTGVVIRDGLYTSNTPEEQDGRWKWMRFSAATSPGNSGGPLLDKNGKVIGVVLMKSANENLNYALPIGEVLAAPDGQGVMDVRAGYQLDIFDSPKAGTLKAQFKLPLGLPAFYREYRKHFDRFGQDGLKALLAQESANLFPRGNGSARLLHQATQFDSFPSLIVRGSSGEWARMGASSQHFALEGNGYVDIGAVGRNLLAHVRRPDGVDAATFYRDAGLRMDLLVRSGLFTRAVGDQKIKITSLGRPVSESVHVDRWQRPWQVSLWPMPHTNTVVVQYALMVPDGYVMLSRFEPASRTHDTRLDLDELSNFIYVTYSGSLAQWKQYLARPALQPAALKDIRIDFDYGQRFSYVSPRVAFAYPDEAQPVSANNLLSLGFRFLLDKGRPAWDVGAVNIWKTSTSDDSDRISVQRLDEPPTGLDDDMRSRWEKLSQRRYPYNGTARLEDDQMMISTVVAQAGLGEEAPKVLYTAFYGVEGNQPQAQMKHKLELLTRDMRVLEH